MYVCIYVYSLYMYVRTYVCLYLRSPIHTCTHVDTFVYARHNIIPNTSYIFIVYILSILFLF